MEVYDVFLLDKPIGTAEVEKQGLYYHIRILCNPDGEGMYQVRILCGDRRENLGVLVPTEGRFGLETRIPVKKIGTGKPEFQVRPRHGAVNGKYIPISPEEPFRYLSRLKDSFLEIRNEGLGIVITEPGHSEP